MLSESALSMTPASELLTSLGSKGLVTSGSVLLMTTVEIQLIIQGSVFRLSF